MRTLVDLFLQVADAPSRADLLTFQRKDGTLNSYSTAAFVEAVLGVRRYLRELGLQEGDRVALWAANCPEWHIADFACHAAGLVVVPLYATAPPAQVEFILNHSEARAVFFAGDTQAAIVHGLRDKLPHVSGFIALDNRSGLWHDRLSDRLTALAGANELESVREFAKTASDQSLAGIVYTSGTTGQPKGVMLTHANICFDLEQCMKRLEFRSVERALSILPLAHVFERLLCYGYFASGIAIAYGDPYDLKELVALHRPTVVGCVPRILERIFESVEAEIKLQRKGRQKIARWMIRNNLRRVLKRDVISTLPASLLAKPTLFRKMRKKLPGLQFFVCGGAKLKPEIEAFFRAAGYGVLQGYGLTETSPVVALNRLGPGGLGTVGHPLDGVEVRIDEHGEVFTRGGHVMKGYFKDPQATQEAIRDGWFNTGDLGSIDHTGRLIIAARARDTIVLSTGKKVSSSQVEQLLADCSIIQSAIVLGNHRKFLSAIIIPHWDRLQQAAAERNWLGPTLDSPEIHPDLSAWLAAEIARVTASMAEHERIKRFCLLHEEALLDPDVMTPTQKLRRNSIESIYQAWIDRMYSDPVPFLITGKAMIAAGASSRAFR